MSESPRPRIPGRRLAGMGTSESESPSNDPIKGVARSKPLPNLCNVLLSEPCIRPPTVSISGGAILSIFLSTLPPTSLAFFHTLEPMSAKRFQKPAAISLSLTIKSNHTLYHTPLTLLKLNNMSPGFFAKLWSGIKKVGKGVVNAVRKAKQLRAAVTEKAMPILSKLPVVGTVLSTMQPAIHYTANNGGRTIIPSPMSIVADKLFDTDAG